MRFKMQSNDWFLNTWLDHVISIDILLSILSLFMQAAEISPMLTDSILGKDAPHNMHLLQEN